MMQHLAKLRQLAPTDRRLLFESAFSLAVIRLALWCVPFRVWSVRPPPPLRAQMAPQPELARLVWAVAAASRVVPCATCLVRALAARRIFANHGYPATVRIGVARSPAAGFAAHAWLQHEGRVLPGSASGPFTAILSL
jgi:hypothetical protein